MVLGPIDFHSIDKKYYENQWDPKLFGHQHSSKYKVNIQSGSKKLIKVVLRQEHGFRF